MYNLANVSSLTVACIRQMGGLECVITGIVDEFGASLKRWHLSRRLVTLMIVASSFLVALISLTPVIVGVTDLTPVMVDPTDLTPVIVDPTDLTHTGNS